MGRAPLSLNILSARMYPSSVERMPMPAPASTSDIQCRLFICLPIAVAVEAVYPAMLYRGLRYWPYSLCRKLAFIKELAVCPEGKELLELPSGRSTLAVYLMLFTSAPMIRAENA